MLYVQTRWLCAFMEKTVKKFYDALVARFDIEEAWAERQLKTASIPVRFAKLYHDGRIA